MLLERKDDKFADAVDKVLSDGWQLVNVEWAGYGELILDILQEVNDL